MSLTGKAPAPGYYCPVCGEVRRVRRPYGDREVRVVKKSDDVYVFSHTRAELTSMKSHCPGGRASRSADRAP